MICELKLTNSECVVLIDQDDYERCKGITWRLNSRGYVAGCLPKSIYGKRKSVLLHRYILGLTDPKIYVDHKNRIKLDCCKTNLRTCTSGLNQANREIPRNNKSGYKGVWWSKRHSRWYSAICVNRKRIHVGYFDCVKHAARAYDKYALQNFGEFALLNFPDENPLEFDDGIKRKTQILNQCA